MKAKRYTKTQIKEAIEFWTKILENKSPLLDALVDDFGYGIVFNDVPVVLTLKGINDLFDKLNIFCFEGKLKKWPFIVDDELCRSSDAICGYVNSMLSNVEKEQYDVVMKDTIVDGELYRSPFYALTSKLANGHECSLILAASILAHEMIHQFNFEVEDEGAIQWRCDAHDETYDKHGENFEKWMEKLNSEHGLFIKKSSIKSISNLNVDALKTLKKFTGNDYKNEMNEIEDSISGHKILKHNDDYSAFTQFL